MRVVLHPEVAVSIKVNIARSLEEAETQAKTGEAFMSNEPVDEIEELIQAAEDAAAEGYEMSSRD